MKRHVVILLCIALSLLFSMNFACAEEAVSDDAVEDIEEVADDTVLGGDLEGSPEEPAEDISQSLPGTSMDDDTAQSLGSETYDNYNIDIAGMTVDELLDLRQQIEDALLEKGYNPYYDIERGDKGENVSAVQEKLTELGYYSGAISGKFDNETQKAFKQFEKANGLENDGLASKEDQVVLFSSEVVLKPTATLRSEVTASPYDELYSDYGKLDYEDCFRYPEKHYGEKVVLKGRVLQAVGDKHTGYYIRLATSGSEDVVYLTIDKPLEFNILDGDRLTVYATMNGTYTYESVLGNVVTLPAANAVEVVLR